MTFLQRLVRKAVTNLPPGLQAPVRVHYTNNSIEFCIQKLKAKGFHPQEIVDCGAYRGDWTRMIKQVFPESRVLMFEPQGDKQPLLDEVRKDFAGSVQHVRCLLGPVEKEAVTFFEMESGSSVLEELTNVPRKTVQMPMRTLDNVLKEKGMENATFLKLDVQGYEVEVLKGAALAMKRAEVILLEVSFVPYNRSAPLFHEVLEFMSQHGFLVHDLCNLQRWEGETLLQADVFFAKVDSPLRRLDLVVKEYASPNKGPV